MCWPVLKITSTDCRGRLIVLLQHLMVSNIQLANIQLASKLPLPCYPLLPGWGWCLGVKPFVPSTSCLTWPCLSRSGISSSKYPTNGRYLTMLLVRDDPEEFQALFLRTTLSGPTIIHACFHQHDLDMLHVLLASKHHSLFSFSPHYCQKIP